ncbi:E3 ubiquitin-protein ligase CCNB1IP1-like isoform X2 [Dendronephthya gigantea]|uniref:E3 ubiquitin-protein ligase CCNB1IP1-like isoform X1 n=1 Tax=Dendronephthya gigantea TaxID=151771 RepID=UPI00106B25F3|nr:E3 ubiquitin-protein ligase CCNB1IP1-like isoform X1 [Dendronephthya gigantea]XP_028411082.1 E3 ubiquitin-protein ligase CCNB1IP1-like isoform X2 [Dendronephthya gigantea]
MDNDLLCNFRKCRKRLSSFSWVTSCSHIFCDEDGTREFNKAYVCPACETNLSGKFDIVRIDLHPTEQYKSMILAGQRPETIMEICSRALSFWTYQAHQERTYQEYVSSKSKEKNIQLENYYEQLIAKSQQEISSLKSEISNKVKELDETRKRLHEASEKLQERSRQHQKLQVMYDTLRRKSINHSVFNYGEGSLTADVGRRRSAFDLTLGTAADILSRNSHSNSLVDLSRIPGNNNALVNLPEKEFVWKPTSTVEDQCEVHTPLHIEAQSLHNQAHLEIPGSGIKRRLGIKKM